MKPLTVHYKRALGGTLVALGLTVLAMNLLLKDWANVAGAIVFLGLALWFLTAPAAVITSSAVERRTPIGVVGGHQRIDGLADLRLEGRCLWRVSDGKKIGHLGWALRPEDLATLDFHIRKAQASKTVAPRMS